MPTASASHLHQNDAPRLIIVESDKVEKKHHKPHNHGNHHHHDVCEYKHDKYNKSKSLDLYGFVMFMLGIIAAAMVFLVTRAIVEITKKK